MHSHRILVVEDDPASLELVQVYLESLGYEVVGAPDGNRALDLGGSGRYELMILDVNLPLYGGVEVLQMLRKRHLLHPMRVIALTADPRPEIRDQLLQGGIDSILAKPVTLAKLRDEVARLLAKPAMAGARGPGAPDPNP